jgi:hypothetical protein
MAKEVSYNRSGLGIPGALFITFVVLKLTGVIDWSWVWVTAPLWIGWVLFGVLAMLIISLMAFLDHRDRVRRKRRRQSRTSL